MGTLGLHPQSHPSRAVAAARRLGIPACASTWRMVALARDEEHGGRPSSPGSPRSCCCPGVRCVEVAAPPGQASIPDLPLKRAGWPRLRPRCKGGSFAMLPNDSARRSIFPLYRIRASVGPYRPGRPEACTAARLARGKNRSGSRRRPSVTALLQKAKGRRAQPTKLAIPGRIDAPDFGLRLRVEIASRLATRSAAPPRPAKPPTAAAALSTKRLPCATGSPATGSRCVTHPGLVR